NNNTEYSNLHIDVIVCGIVGGCVVLILNESGNEDKHLHENYTDRNIPLENGENDKEHNYRESSTFIP
ncbi:18523_t:CDS:2, partial [Gigaspora rosea]